MARDRIETVLRLRRLTEQQARAALGRAAGQIIAAEAAVTSAIDDLAAHGSDVTTLGELLLSRAVGVGLQQRVADARSQLLAAHDEHARRSEAWRMARAEEHAVERLLDRRREVARREAQIAEQAQMDELALLVRTGSAA